MPVIPASILTLVCLAVQLACAQVSAAGELGTLYTTIDFDSPRQLQALNERLSSRRLLSFFRQKENRTVDQELKVKVDSLVEKVETILEMFPVRLHFTIRLHSSVEELQQLYAGKYGRRKEFIAFYAPEDLTIHLSVADIRLGVLAHEVAHVVIDQHFQVSPSVKIHELLAQYVEEQLGKEGGADGLFP